MIFAPSGICSPSGDRNLRHSNHHPSSSREGEVPMQQGVQGDAVPLPVFHRAIYIEGIRI